MTTNANIKSQLDYYLRLMRLDRPIGTLLLLWPTLIGLLFAFNGTPNSTIIFIFIAGVFLTRAAGCAINDFADRHFDKHVKRTEARPLATGQITSKMALFLFIVLLILAGLLLFFLNIYCLIVAIANVIMMAIYPFLKRYTNLPQIWLGMTFNGVPMAFAAAEKFNTVAILLYITTVLFAVAYDTYYAMVDRDDDLKIGIKSTAILFGQLDRKIIFILQIIAFLILTFIGLMTRVNGWFYAGLIGGLLFAIYQAWLTADLKTEHYFRAFLNSHWLLFCVFLGTFLSFN